MDQEKRFADWFTHQYLRWQLQQGGRRTTIEFGEWLGIKQATISNYMTGKRLPRGETVDQLAGKLGAVVYDVLGLARPDTHLQAITRAWDYLTDLDKLELLEQVQEMLNAHPEAESPDLQVVLEKIAEAMKA